jgi:F420-dependent methylenetetrahydromethanopterin dehydrogenase
MSLPNLEPHEVAIRNWAQQVLERLDPDYVVIYSHQDAAPPPEPYATITLLSDGPRDTERVLWTDRPGTVDPTKAEQDVEGERLGTFSVTVFSMDHRRDARQLELSLHDQDSVLLFDSAGVHVLHEVGPSTESRVERAVAFQHFTPIDFEFSWSASRTSEAAYMDNFQVTGKPGSDVEGVDAS